MSLELPIPIPTPETQPFWDATARGELQMQHCAVCEKFYFYPRAFCPRCWSEDVEWRTLSGRGTIASFAIDFRPLPLWETDEPRILVLVDLDEGPRLASNIVGIPPDPELLAVGMPVHATFEPCGDQWLPMFVLDERN